MSGRLARTIGALAMGSVIAVGGAGATQAAVVSAMPNAALSDAPVTVSLGDGAASYAFTSASTGFGPGAAVATSGTAQVATLGGVADFSAGATIDQTGELYAFAPSPNAATIPFSAADDFIGLAFTLSDGQHFGYAEVDGPTLVSYGYESDPGASILTGAVGPAAVPEPGSALLLAAGLAGLTALACGGRRRRPASL